MAKLNLYASQGLEIVAIEKFDHLTTSVDCNDDDGVMSLTFNSEDAFQSALQIWSKATAKDHDKFLLIANHEGCGPAEERQPYIVSKVTEDAKDRTTFLQAKPASWPSVAGTYDVQFGKAAQNGSSDVQSRGLVGCAIHGDCSHTDKFTVPISLGKQNSPSTIYHADSGNFALDCTNCYVQGSFDVEGTVSVKDFKFSDVSLTTTAHGFNAMLALKATIAASTTPAALGKQISVLPPTAIPDLGIEIPKLFTLGTSVSYDIGFNVSIAGNATFDFGVKSSIPDGAKATIDAGNQDGSSADGFQGDAQPFFNLDDLSASVSLDVFSKPKIEFGIETPVFNFDIGVGVTLPELIATLTAKYDEAGACPNDPKHTKTGAQLNLQAGVAIDAEIDAHVGSGSGTALPNYSKNLFKKLWDLPFSPCLPVAIPGLEPTATNSATPTILSSSVTASASMSSLMAASSVIVPSTTAPFPTMRNGTTSNPTGTAAASGKLIVNGPAALPTIL